MAWLSQQFQAAMAMPEILGLDGPKFDAMIAAEFVRWGELIRKRGITVQAS